MAFPSRFSRFAVTYLLLTLFLVGCAVPGPRPFYSRKSGDWVTPGASTGSTAKRPSGLSSPGGEAERLRRIGEAYLGVPYRFGGQSRSGMDCSGFVRQVFSEAVGVKLPHNSAAMWNHGESVSRSDLRPGDILFFKGWFVIDHSAIYMGDNWFLHSQSGVGVCYTRLDAPYFKSHYAGARRVLP